MPGDLCGAPPRSLGSPAPWVSVAGALLLGALAARGAAEARGLTGLAPERERLGRDRTWLAYRPGRADEELAGHGHGRRLKQHYVAEQWEPIRIHLELGQLENEVQSAAKVAAYRELLEAAVRWFSLALRVRPVVGRLKFEKPCVAINRISGSCAQVSDSYQACGDATIPAEHFGDRKFCSDGFDFFCEVSPGGKGIGNADFALYVTARNTAACKGGGTAAYAGVCLQDQVDRPIAGFINFCNVPQHRDWSMGVATAMHEILHALGFSSSLFAFFRDDAGQPRTPRDEFGLPPYDASDYRASADTVYRTVLADGTRRHYVVLPRVLDAARQHFACPSLEHVPLEEAGGDGTSFSHWDDRYMQTEIMTPDTNSFPVLSTLTLALLEDSGWYRASYDAAGPFEFGRGRGCDFLDRKCVEDGVTLFPETFCTANGGSCSRGGGLHACSHDLMAKATCGNCVHNRPLPKKFQYFSNPRMGGIHQYLGYCPIWEPFEYCSSGNARVDYYGESYGPASLCVISDAISTSYRLPDQPVGTCREVRCDSSALRVRVGDVWTACSAAEAGSSKGVNRTGWRGSIVCPSHQQVCEHGGGDGTVLRGAVPCLFPGVLRHGRCACAAGHLDEQCTAQDSQANRPSYPYGLHFLQQELVLAVGVPLAQSTGVSSWPLTPKTLSGPRGLQYSTSPALPDGLVLSLEQGTLSGTPTQSVARGPYTIRAAGARGAATTTLFITVACSPGQQACNQAEPGAPSDVFTQGVKQEAPESDLPTNQTGPTAPAGTRLMRIVLGPSFRDIQSAVGLEPFAAAFTDALSAAANFIVVVSYMSALPSGRAQVEFHLGIDSALEPISREAFEVAVGRLVGQFEDESSALMESAFGQRYLQLAELWLVNEDGLVRAWPPIDENDDPFWLRVLKKYWYFLAGFALLVLLACLWRRCRRRRRCGREETAPMRPDYGPRAAAQGCNWPPPSNSQVTPTVVGLPAGVAQQPFDAAGANLAISQLLEMGYDFDAAKHALEANGWDVSRAVATLAATQGGAGQWHQAG